MAAFVPKREAPAFPKRIFPVLARTIKRVLGLMLKKVSLFLPDGGGVHHRFRSGYPAGDPVPQSLIDDYILPRLQSQTPDLPSPGMGPCFLALTYFIGIVCALTPITGLWSM